MVKRTPLAALLLCMVSCISCVHAQQQKLGGQQGLGGQQSLQGTAPPRLVITTNSLPDATVNSVYSQAVSTVNGILPITCTIGFGSLPPGLAINSSTCTISGTPITAGFFPFTVFAFDSTLPTSQTATKDLSISVGCPPLSLGTVGPIPPATINVAYDFQFQPIGGLTPDTFTATGLPAGMSMTMGGLLTGTPTAAGSFTIAVTLHDSCNPVQTVEQNYDFAVNSPVIIQTTSPLTNGTVGTLYSQQFTASGGTSPYTWLLSSGTLPAGLTLVSNGTLSGTLAAGSAGTYMFKVQATDSAAHTTNANFTLTVSCPALSITSSATLPTATQSSFYSNSLQATGGLGTLTWTMDANSTLPAGLSLSSTGTLSGTPITPGTFTFTLDLTDTCPQTVTQDFTIIINASLQITTLALQNGVVGQLFQQQIQAQGGVPPYSWSVPSAPVPAGAEDILDYAAMPVATRYTSHLSATGLYKAYRLNAGLLWWIKNSQGYPWDGEVVGDDYIRQWFTEMDSSQNAQCQAAGWPSCFSDPQAYKKYRTPVPLWKRYHVPGADDVVFTSGPNIYDLTANCGADNQTGIDNLGVRGELTGPFTDVTWQTTYGGNIPDNTPYLLAQKWIKCTANDITTCQNEEDYWLVKAYGQVRWCPKTNSGGTFVTGTCTTQTNVVAGGAPTPNFACKVPNLDLDNNLPPGNTLTSSTSLNLVDNTGLVTGTPNTAGTYGPVVQVEDSVGTITQQQYSMQVTCPAFSLVSTSPLPVGSQASPYNFQFQVSGGISPVAYSESGTLPTGMTLSSIGLLSGTPVNFGTFLFTVFAKDSCAPLGQSRQNTYSLTVNANSGPLTISTASPLPSAIEGTLYQTQITATGGTTPYAFTVSAGTLPAGMTLSGTGVLSGTPTSAGTSSFTVKITDNIGTVVTKAFSLTVNCPSFGITSTSPLPAATATQTYAFQFTSSGGVGTKTWALQTGSTLPAGLSLSGSGALTGTPTTPGTSGFVVQVTDSCAPTPQIKTLSVSLTVNPAPVPLQITTTNLANGLEGTPYSQQLNATGGTAPYTWALDSGTLPPGLSLPSSGLISGTPTSAGTFPITVRVTDSASGTTTQALSITISCPPLGITSTSPLPTGNQNQLYNGFQFTSSGGFGTITWSLASGTLPTGMNLSGSGALTGTSTNAGTFTIGVRATDSCSPTPQTFTKSFTLTIIPALTITTATPLPSATVGQPYNAPLAAQGGVPPYTWSVSAGSLPSGLVLNAPGSITGTPTTTTAPGFTLRVTDSASNTITKAFTMAISCPSFSLVSGLTLPTGTVGSNYSFQFVATGGVPPYSWTRTGGAFPAGLTFPVTGLLSGTPTASGSFSPIVQVADSCPPTPQIISNTFGLTINPAPVPVVIDTPDPLPSATENVAYATTLSAHGGTGPYSWSIQSGSLAPFGLATNGTITGTNSTANTVTATVLVTDSLGATATATFHITTVCNPLSIVSNANLPNGTQGSPYSSQLTFSGGTGTVTCSLTGGTLPTGVTLSAGCLISGTPSANGTFNPQITFTDSCNPTPQTPNRTFTLVIAPTPVPLQITTTSPLPTATQGQNLSVTFSATGGTPPYGSWTITSGTQPTGTSLNSSTGVLSGTLSAAGTFIFTVQVTDNVAATASKSFTIAINPATAEDNTYCNPNGTWIGPTTDRVAALPTACNYTAIAATPASGPTKTVCASGCDFTTVNAALTASSCGWIIQIKAKSGSSQATYSGFTLPVKCTTSANWIWIETDQINATGMAAPGTRITPAWVGIGSLPGRPAYAQPSNGAGIFLPKILCSSSNCIDRTSGAKFYRIIGLEITSIAGTTIADLTRTTNTDNIIWDRVLIHGGNSSTGQSRDNVTRAFDWQQSTHQSLIDSWCYDIHTAGPGSQCFNLGGISSVTEGPFKVVNNFLEAADSFSGIGGGGVGNSTLVPCCIELRRNHIYKPVFWKANDATYFGTKFTIKNGIDWKNVQKSLIEGNIVEFSWGQQSDQPGPLGEWGAKNQSSSTSGTATSSGNTLTAKTGAFPASVVSPNCANPSHCVIKFNGVKYQAQTRIDSTHVTVAPAPPTTSTAAAFTAYAPGLNPNAQVSDITIRYNIFRHGSRCLEMFSAGSDANDIGKFTGRFSVHDNVCDDIDGGHWNLSGGACCAWSIGLYVDNEFPSPNYMDQLWFDHNTFIIHQSSGSVGSGPSLGFGSQTKSTGWIGHLKFTNNLSPAGLGRSLNGVCTGTSTALGNLECWDAINGVAQNTYCMDHNGLVTTTLGTISGTANNPPYPGAGQSPGCGFLATGNTLLGSYALAEFVNLNNGSGGDYHLQVTSPFHNAGSDGKDLGADIDLVNKFTAGVN